MAALKAIVRLARGPRWARLLQAVAYVAAVVWLLGVFVVAARVTAASTYSELPMVVLFGAIVIAAIGASVFSALGDLFGQHARDLGAQSTYDAIIQGRTPPRYTLYLRPFAATGAFSQVSMGVPMSGALGALGGAEVELEAQIERAVRPLGPLIALGQPLEHVGAGRILVDETGWREAIRLLMRHAELIVMLPSSRAGTLHEIEMIIDSDLIERTVLVDPPNIARSKQFDHGSEWAQVREVFASRNFTVPADSRAGLLLFYGKQRAPQLKERLDIDAEDRIERLFRRVIKVRTSPAFAARQAGETPS